MLSMSMRWHQISTLWTNVSSERDILRDEQKADPTLKKVWLLAEKNKNSFFVKDEHLYHHDNKKA